MLMVLTSNHSLSSAAICVRTRMSANFTIVRRSRVSHVPYPARYFRCAWQWSKSGAAPAGSAFAAGLSHRGPAAARSNQAPAPGNRSYFRPTRLELRYQGFFPDYGVKIAALIQIPEVSMRLSPLAHFSCRRRSCHHRSLLQRRWRNSSRPERRSRRMEHGR